LQTSVGGSLLFVITTKFWIFEKLIIKEQLVPPIRNLKIKKKKKQTNKQTTISWVFQKLQRTIGLHEKTKKYPAIFLTII
jgi:hypothetical protein